MTFGWTNWNFKICHLFLKTCNLAQAALYLLPLIVLLIPVFYYFKTISFISQITIRKEFVGTILILLTQANIKQLPSFLFCLIKGVNR
jgi:hypothetical protein